MIFTSASMCSKVNAKEKYCILYMCRDLFIVRSNFPNFETERKIYNISQDDQTQSNSV